MAVGKGRVLVKSHVEPETRALLVELREQLGISSGDVMGCAVRLLAKTVEAEKRGDQLVIVDRKGRAVAGLHWHGGTSSR